MPLSIRVHVTSLKNLGLDMDNPFKKNKAYA